MGELVLLGIIVLLVTIRLFRFQREPLTGSPIRHVEAKVIHHRWILLFVLALIGAVGLDVLLIVLGLRVLTGPVNDMVFSFLIFWLVASRLYATWRQRAHIVSISALLGAVVAILLREAALLTIWQEGRQAPYGILGIVFAVGVWLWWRWSREDRIEGL